MQSNASSFPWADDVRNPNPFVVSRYDLPVTSRLGRFPTAKQRVFDSGPSGAAVAGMLLLLICTHSRK